MLNTIKKMYLMNYCKIIHRPVLHIGNVDFPSQKQLINYLFAMLHNTMEMYVLHGSCSMCNNKY
jgi:hypothetical protein